MYTMEMAETVVTFQSIQTINRTENVYTYFSLSFSFAFYVNMNMKITQSSHYYVSSSNQLVLRCIFITKTTATIFASLTKPLPSTVQPRFSLHGHLRWLR